MNAWTWRRSRWLRETYHGLGRIVRGVLPWLRPKVKFHDLQGLPVCAFAACDRDCFEPVLPAARSCPPPSGTPPVPPTSREAAWLQQPVVPVGPPGIYRLSNVRFAGRAYCLRGRRVCACPATIQTYWRDLLQASPWLVPAPRWLTAKKISQPAVLCISRDYNSYGHWWLDIAPRIHLLWRYRPALLRESALVLPADLAPWARDVLADVFGITGASTELVLFDPDSELVACRTAYVPTMLHLDHDFHPAANELYQRVADMCRHERVPTSNDLIYVTRGRYASARGAFVRQLANAAAAESLAESLGFTVIAPEQLSWRQQVALFANARVVAGEHGSAMKNTLFSPPGTVTVVINYLNSNQRQLAALRGQRYVVLEAEGFDPNNHAASYTVDLARLRACLEWAVQKSRRECPGLNDR